MRTSFRIGHHFRDLELFHEALGLLRQPGKISRLKNNGPIIELTDGLIKPPHSALMKVLLPWKLQQKNLPLGSQIPHQKQIFFEFGDLRFQFTLMSKPSMKLQAKFKIIRS